MTKPWQNITKPTFIIDKQRAINNIDVLVKKFSKSNTLFRPHFKTHQSNEVGSWYRGKGIQQISVSSVDMAWQFYQAGWKDISIVFPFNRREMEWVNKMSVDAQINLLVEDLDTLHFLDKHCEHPIGIFIKIDCGYHRTGVDANNIASVKQLAHKSKESSKLKFKGILSHFGNTYAARSREAVTEIYYDGLQKMNLIKQELVVDFPETIISIGDTPSASIINDFSGIDEMRPGNFVFYDWMQKEIGSCSENQIAVIVLCPVVAKHAERKELIIHGGAVHFSKEKGDQHFGAITDISQGFSTKTIDNCYLKSLSQEHGIVKCKNDFFDKTQIGDLIGVIPIHSCLTANLMKNATQIV
jgi:D-serine deaminase-like pyridoxal phosphate-dependent protein